MVSNEFIALIVVRGSLEKDEATNRTGLESMDLSEKVLGVVGVKFQTDALPIYLRCTHKHECRFFPVRGGFFYFSVLPRDDIEAAILRRVSWKRPFTASNCWIETILVRSFRASRRTCFWIFSRVVLCRPRTYELESSDYLNTCLHTLDASIILGAKYISSSYLRWIARLTSTCADWSTSSVRNRRIWT